MKGSKQILSDVRILAEIGKGNIVIEPFDRRCLGPNSYDCRLGEWYYAQMGSGYDLKLFSEEARDVWGHPRMAIDGEIPVRPGETILAHTQEVVGGRFGYLARLYTRSTVARHGLSVHRQAGLGDVGYINRWTLEVHNGTLNTIILPVGCRIGQFVFDYVGDTFRHYDGAYKQQKEWLPSDMLPSAKPDWAVEEWKAQQSELESK